MNISESIRQVRDEFVKDGLATSYYQINCGLCEELAVEAMSRVTQGKENLWDAQPENFMDDDNECFDFDLLASHWGIEPPEGVTQAMLNEDIRFGNHVFVADANLKLFYDSECPDGVSSFFDLPLYRRSIVKHLRSIGVAAEDVVTQDVVPAPACPIQNPAPRDPEGPSF